MKKALSFILVLILILSISVVSFCAADYGCDVDTSSSAVYLENLNTGTVVFEKNADEKVPPASLTKIMTYIVVTENIPDVENTTITIEEGAFDTLDPASSVMGLQGYIGEEFTVLDLLYGLMLPSGNDAALVLADYIGDGVVDNFVDMMNRKAGQLGCTGTHFVNPHGLYDSMHYSTANDMAVIAKYAMEKPFFMEITGTARHNVDNMKEDLETTNYMIDKNKTEYYYPYVVSGKTGYTDEAGKCLVTAAKKDDYDYLCITLGAPYSYADEINYAMLDSKELYEWAFNNLSIVDLLEDGAVVGSLPVAYVWGDKSVDAVADGAVSALLPNDYDESLVETKIDLPYSTQAPVHLDQKLGTISVYYDGELVGATNLVSPEEIEVDKLSVFAHNTVDFVKNNIIIITVVLAIAVFLIVVKISSVRNRKKRKARRRYR
ncbi:MAG: D-alanyl-D-alanine carboxypeptidase [Ruminococcaceae bacterium]|nr:D-alanyl-D-alanine carboxypeptidase [Oscillospiraceae bacterium]